MNEGESTKRSKFNKKLHFAIVLPHKIMKRVFLLALFIVLVCQPPQSTHRLFATAIADGGGGGGGGGDDVVTSITDQLFRTGRNETYGGDFGFMSDSRLGLGRGGGGGTSSPPWTFPSATARSRIVETKYGKVQGLSLTLFSNIHYSASRNFPLKSKIVEIFFGIPYAAPPVKSHRFSPTQTPVPWNDVKPTIQPSPVCPQIFPDIRNESAALKDMPKGYLEYLRRVEPYLRNQSEDCLYLNIFSPIGPDAKLKPVLVYFHGGMFAWGSGSIVDGTVMSAYSDVIFVSINYRLSILGFLNLNDSPTSKPRVSNYGLMDQIAALHWIKENVRSFGGDPDNITLMGYEAGAACINFLMSSPTVTPGLFHRSILISGSSHAPWALISEPSVAGYSIAQALNCSPSGNASSSSSSSGAVGKGEDGGATTTTTAHPHAMDPVIECLKTKHFTEFTKFTLPKFSVDFGPSVDGIVVKSNFRSMSSLQMGKRDAVAKKYDILVGLSSLERLTEFSEMDLEFGFEAVRRDAVLRTLVRNSYRYHRNEILATVTNEYTDWERTAQHPVSTRDMTVNAVTDCLSLAPIVAITDSNVVKKAFFYVFEHSTKDGLFNYHRAGAGGGEELNYAFGYPLVESATGQVLSFIPAPLPSNYSKGEVALSELWMTFISNFVHSGNPNGPIKIDSVSTWPVSKERNRYKNTVWEPYDRLHQKYLEVGANKIRTRSHYRAHQMAIWLRLVPELQRSGAQMASTYHNRMKGGNDPALYAGRLKEPVEEEDPSDPGGTNSGLNSALLYDLLLGYTVGGGAGGGTGLDSISIIGADGQSLSGAGDGESEILEGLHNNKGGKGNPALTMTTCYSPVSSSVQSGNRGGVGAGGNDSTSSSSQTKNTFFDPKHFPPYSVILAITIAVGCALLILNFSIFAVFYFRRDRKRGKLLNPSANTSGEVYSQRGDGSEMEEMPSTPTNNKFSYVNEPPELLKSNRTTASSFLQGSQTHLQSEMEALEVLELTVKQHQQELLGEKALLTMESATLHHQSGGGGGFPYSYSTHTLPSSAKATGEYPVSCHQQQQPHLHLQQGVMVSSSPSSAASSTSAQPTSVPVSTSTPLAVSTLPRCNGGFGFSSFIAGGTGGGTSTFSRPHPPPRVVSGPPTTASSSSSSTAGASTSVVGVGQVGTLKKGLKRVEYSDTYNSDSNNENDELKV